MACLFPMSLLGVKKCISLTEIFFVCSYATERKKGMEQAVTPTPHTPTHRHPHPNSQLHTG